MELYQSLIFIIFSFCAPIITFGGGILVSNALTLAGVDLVAAAGMTVVYFFLNGTIALFFFRGHIVWSEVRAILPLATVGSLLGALFLSYSSPLILLCLMLSFAVRFLYQSVLTKKTNQKEEGLAVWGLALLSGFLASAALPGGGLRNNYMLAKGYSLSEMYGTTQVIGSIGWITSIAILFYRNILSFQNIAILIYLIPVFILINFFLQKGLVRISSLWSRRVSIASISIFILYGIFSVGMHLVS